HDRHGRRDQRGGIGPDHEVDLVDVEQLGVDRRDLGGRALVIVVDELHRTAEYPALGGDVLFPNLLPEPRPPSVRPEPAGQRHAVADLDRLAGLRRGRRGGERADDQREGTGAGERPAFQVKGHHCSSRFGFGWWFGGIYSGNPRKWASGTMPRLKRYRVASPASTMMVSTSPAPLRRNAAAATDSGGGKKAAPCAKGGNSSATKGRKLPGPSM